MGSSFRKGRVVTSSRLRRQSSSNGASRNIEVQGRSNSRLFGCANVPPPSATTVSRSSDSISSRRALVSATRKPDSPRSRKISEMVCRSRDSIRVSRFTKSKSRRRASSWATLRLPEAMYPTRNTARTSMALHGTKWGGFPPQVRAYLLRLIFSLVQRCLRRILPLKERRTTSDAALPTVPKKERPASKENRECLGCKGQSFWTRPRTEGALKSAETSAGGGASILPVWVGKLLSPPERKS